MPKRLPQRCLPDSIQEFRAAARQRFQEGLDLEAAGRRTAAIYLWGYSAEMTLKAAYFTVAGFAEDQAIAVSDLRNAAMSGLALGVRWLGAPGRLNLHDLRSWAELLVHTRATMAGLAYPVRFARQVVAQGQHLQRLWSETLRYHKNMAYEFETRQVRESVQWLLDQTPNL